MKVKYVLFLVIADRGQRTIDLRGNDTGRQNQKSEKKVQDGTNSKGASTTVTSGTSGSRGGIGINWSSGKEVNKSKEVVERNWNLRPNQRSIEKRRRVAKSEINRERKE